MLKGLSTRQAIELTWFITGIPILLARLIMFLRSLSSSVVRCPYLSRNLSASATRLSGLVSPRFVSGICTGFVAIVSVAKISVSKRKGVTVLVIMKGRGWRGEGGVGVGFREPATRQEYGPR